MKTDLTERRVASAGRPLSAPSSWKESQDLSWAEQIIQVSAALIGLALLSPLFLVIAILVKLTSRGPVFYRGERVGQFGRTFEIFKFRTLQMNAEREIGARLLTRADNYYTYIGRILKATKLDEFPQLLNVIRGEMNFVGPRPVRPIFLMKFVKEIPNYNLRFLMKPGITGLAQIRGTYYTHPRDKLRYELFYLTHRSFIMDLHLILLTFVKILNKWVRLGVVLLVLFLFVSFVPAWLQKQMYINFWDLRFNVLHAIVLLLGVWLIAKKIPGHRLYLYRNKLNLPILCFLLIGLISALCSDDLVDALRGLTYYAVTGFFVALLIINTPITRGFLRRSGKVVALSCVAISAIGLAKVVAVGNPVVNAGMAEEAQRFFSNDGIVATMASSGALAMYLILGIPFVLIQVTHASKRETRDFWVVCTTIVLIAVLLTKSLFGLLGLLTTMGVYAKSYFRFRFSNTLIFALAIAVTCLSLWVNVQYGDRLLNAVCARANDVRMALENMPVAKLLLGFGPRRLATREAWLLIGKEKESESPPGIAKSGHMRLVLEYGIIGWGVFIWLIYAFAASIVRADRRVTDHYVKGTLWATLSAVLGFTVALAGVHAFSSLTLQVFFWSLIGTGVAVTLHQTGRSEGFRIIWRFGNEQD